MNALAALLFLGVGAGDVQAKQDLEAFRAFLKEAHVGKKWLEGPTRLDSPSIKAAYGDRRFYFVFSRPPLMPGVNAGINIKAYKERLEEFSNKHISLVVRIEEGKVVPLTRAADYNAGLMAVASDDDARTAAAAILSLYGWDHASPGVVDPKEVQVTRGEKGWSCQAQRKGAFAGTVMLDPKGQCTSVTKYYIGPMPP
jgi:hypothetical protein